MKKKSNKNTIAIIIPAYNASATIKRTLDSLKNQKVPPDQIIVVDDGSTDNTADLVSQLMPSAELVKLPENQGCYHAIIGGLDVVKCDYTVKLDADDEITDGFIECAKNILTRYEYDYISIPKYKIMTNNQTILIKDKGCQDIKKANDCLNIFFSKSIPWYITGIIVKTDIWRKSIDRSIPKKIILDDVFISLKLHAFSKSYICPETDQGYKYYFGIGYWSGNKESITLEEFTRNVEMRRLQYHNNVDFLKSNKFDNEYIGLLYTKCDMETLFQILAFLPVKDMTEALNILNKNFILFPK